MEFGNTGVLNEGADGSELDAWAWPRAMVA